MRLLVIRLSALGDVAILAPIVRLRAEANPDVTFLIAAPPRLQPLFDGMGNVEFVPTDRHQSPLSLYRQWSALKPDMVADMHNVNRVVATDLLFLLHGTPIHHIRKGKYKRWQMTRRHCKRLDPLTPSWKRYDMVFDHCGLKKSVQDTTSSNITHSSLHIPHSASFTIGIAPYAQHRGKTWPPERMEKLVAELVKKHDNYNIVLFGGSNDQATLDQWAARYERTTSLAGKKSFNEELSAIAQLDVMVSMDSANMHFASAVGVPVVSIWGATHPDAGFYGWRQPTDNIIQAPLPCRPCSAFGKKRCRFGDYRCLQAINVEDVELKIEELLNAEVLR